MFRRRRNTISAQALKHSTDKIMKKTLRDAKKRIKRGELLDCRSLGMYLNSIDARYEHIKADVGNSTRVTDYMSVRSRRVAETRQLIDFYDTDYAELRSLYKIVARKAEEAGRVDDFNSDRAIPPSIEKQKKEFDKLTGEYPTTPAKVTDEENSKDVS